METNKEISPSELGILRQPVDYNQVQLDKTKVDWSLVPVVWDSLPSFPVGEVTFLSINSVEVPNMLLGYKRLVCSRVEQSSHLLTQDAVRLLSRMIPEQPPGEDIPCVARNQAGHRAVVEVRIALDGLVET